MILRQCLLCGKQQKLKIVYAATFNKKNLVGRTFSARRKPDRIHYRIVRCQNCGLVFSSPILSPKVIGRLYKQSGCNYQDQISYVKETYWKLFKKFKYLMPKSPKVLEVGCGTGFFLEKLRQEKIDDVWGIEPGRTMVNQAPAWLKKRIRVSIFKKSLMKSGGFDVVCCFHTLDHIVSPTVLIKEAYKILKPGGIVIIVVHDSQGLSVKLFGERSAIFDIEHVYLFNKTTLARLFTSYKFKLIKIDDLINTYPLEYWLKMSGLPDTIKNWGQKALELVKINNRLLSFGGGNIFLLAQK